MLYHLLVHQNVTLYSGGFLIKTKQRLVYPPCRKLGTVLEKFGTVICSPVLLDSSPIIQTYKKEAHY
jgi:hypothetical protein